MSLRGVVAVLLLLGAAAAGGQPSPDAYSGFVSKVQEKLRELGFDAGPVNGDFGAKTQAALAQFQLSRTIPASGQLDDATLAELGVQREQSDGAQNAQKSDAEQNPSAGASVSSDSAEKMPTSEKPGN